MSFVMAKIETAQFYLDQCIKAGKDQNTKKDKRLLKQRHISAIDRMTQKAKSLLGNIIKNFPSIDNLNEFYQELIRSTVDYDLLKKSLASLNWAAKKEESFAKDYKRKVLRCTEEKEAYALRREHLGRFASVFKQIKKHLVYLERVRYVMQDYPTIKEGLFTIAIAGFPNAGKSTLLKKLTGANVEIAAYAFTTKRLNIGYFTAHHLKIQCIDTPGTLNRPEKMNKVEMQAHLAMKYVAELIVLVMDCTDDAEKNTALLHALEKFDKPILIYQSKTDIAEPLPILGSFHDEQAVKQAIIAHIRIV
ncbi:MAG: GTPase [archaeon]